MYIKRGDMVEVLVGEDKGKRGQVTSVNRKKSMVTVQGINVAQKHIKRGHPKRARRVDAWKSKCPCTRAKWL